MTDLFTPIQTAQLNWQGNTALSTEYDAVYYSTDQAIDQAQHVFIQGNDLQNRFSKGFQTGTVAEVGFGAGLNFLITWNLWKQEAPKNTRLHYLACEQQPLQRADLVKVQALWPELAVLASEFQAKYPILTPGYHQLTFESGRLHLTLMLGEAYTCYEQLTQTKDAFLEPKIRCSFVDAWYLNGFTPTKSPRMWSEALLHVVALLSKKETTLASDCSSLALQSSLQELGFSLVLCKGFASKPQMIKACFEGATKQIKRKRQTPWYCSQNIVSSDKEAIVLGAGLAGCFTAYALAKRGWSVRLIERQNSIASAASANKQAVLFPMISAYRSPLTELMLQAHSYAYTLYESFLKQVPLGALKGCLQLVSEDERLKQWLLHYPELGRLVGPEQASYYTGIQIKKSGLYIPHSGWLDMPALCAYLLKSKQIELILDTSVSQLFYEEEHWSVNGYKARYLILCTGSQVNQLAQTQHLPLKSVRGQMTRIKATEESSALKIPLCGAGHVLPARNDQHYLGATYGLWQGDPAIAPQDDIQNKEKLKQLAPDCLWSDEVTNHWAGIRSAMPDYLPLVGQLPMEKQFLLEFSGLASDANRWIGQSNSYYPGLYVCAAFGSRGLSSIPLCAEWLAGMLNQEMGCLPRALIQAISPARFLHRQLIRGKDPMRR